MHDVHISDKLGPPEPEPGGPTTTTVDEAEPDAVEELAEAYNFEENGRKWLRAIGAVLNSYATDSATDRRVQYALDDLSIAAAERACRILRSDLPPLES